MISEVLELCMEGGRVIHNHVIILLVMATVGLVGAGMEVVDGRHVRQSHGGWSHVGRGRALPQCEVIC